MSQTNRLSQQDIWTLRQHAVDTGDCELSRLCSAALWGTAGQRARAMRRLRKAVAS